MTEETQRVLTGFLKLSQNERYDFLQELITYTKMSAQEQAQYEMRLNIRQAIKMALGPLKTPCGCCGK